VARQQFGIRDWHASWWQADHIVPIAEGGPNELSNLRTLCIRCHQAETRKLRRRLADRKENSNGGKRPL